MAVDRRTADGALDDTPGARGNAPDGRVTLAEAVWWARTALATTGADQRPEIAGLDLTISTVPPNKSNEPDLLAIAERLRGGARTGGSGGRGNGVPDTDWERELREADAKDAEAKRLAEEARRAEAEADSKRQACVVAERSLIQRKRAEEYDRMWRPRMTDDLGDATLAKMEEWVAEAERDTTAGACGAKGAELVVSAEVLELRDFLNQRRPGLPAVDSPVPGDHPGVGAGDPIVLGALNRSLIDRVVTSSLSEIRDCYEKELAKNSNLFGKMVIKFVISKDGTVSQAGVKTSTLGNPKVEDCVTGTFRRMRFPAPQGGGIVVVSYPLVFNSRGG